MKDIRVTDIDEIPAADVKPGHVLIEGVVLDVRSQSSHNGELLCYFYDTAADGTTVYAEPQQKVQVLGRVSSGVLRAIQNTLHRKV